ncbi:MAG TPA: hypothetical protein VFE20_07190 [Thermoleophilia bacterium]|nr:hypothetical protein [Thermoleophilia bacterium]
MGRAYRTGILPGFLFSILLSIGVWLTFDALSPRELIWVIAAVIIGGTLWVGPGFSELYARVYVVHYPERSFATFAGTLSFWVAIVFSLIAIILDVPHVTVVVVLNVLSAIIIGFLIPVAYDHGWAGGEDLAQADGRRPPG